jgi:hypothetical protein
MHPYIYIESGPQTKDRQEPIHKINVDYVEILWYHDAKSFNILARFPRAHTNTPDTSPDHHAPRFRREKERDRVSCFGSGFMGTCDNN